MQSRVGDLVPKRDGHFVYESGHHGALWLDLERLCLRPERVEPLAGELAQRLRAQRPDAICGPLVEGAFVGLMVASDLGLPFTYSTPQIVEGGPGNEGGLFPVAYPIPPVLHAQLRGRRVAIVNDVINAGSAVAGTLDALSACDARAVAIATLAVYGDSAERLAKSRGVELVSLARFDSRIWTPQTCPLCAQGVPFSTT